jgi:hypothetical protein
VSWSALTGCLAEGTPGCAVTPDTPLDQLVIVDTGSTDDSVRIAASHAGSARSSPLSRRSACPMGALLVTPSVERSVRSQPNPRRNRRPRPRKLAMDPDACGCCMTTALPPGGLGPPARRGMPVTVRGRRRPQAPHLARPVPAARGWLGDHPLRPTCGCSLEGGARSGSTRPSHRRTGRQHLRNAYPPRFSGTLGGFDRAFWQLRDDPGSSSHPGHACVRLRH